MDWKDATVFVFDTETTGTNVNKDRIVELGAAYFVGGEPGNTHRMRINPGQPIPAEATRIHGISDDDVRDKPTFEVIAERFVDHLTGKICGDEQLVLVGYNGAGFDAPIVNKELERAEQSHRIEPSRVLDVLVFVRWHHRGKRGRKLTDMCSFYDVALVDAHSALADAYSTGQLLFKMIEAERIPDTVEAAYEEQARLSTLIDAEWAQWSYWLFRDRESEQLTIGAGKYCGQLLENVDTDYLRYLLQTIPDLPEAVRDEFGRRSG